MSSYEVTVPGWPPPRGYVNGRVCSGSPLHVAGQIGWTAAGKFEAADLVGQFAQALDNVLAVVRAAGRGPEAIASMTVFVTDVPAYRIARRPLGEVWQARMGKHYPAMALVGTPMLVEAEALVEIQAVAYV